MGGRRSDRGLFTVLPEETTAYSVEDVVMAKLNAGK